MLELLAAIYQNPSNYMVEITLCELVYLWPLHRRKHFALRFAGGFAVMLLLPHLTQMNRTLSGPNLFGVFAQMLLFVAASIAVMCFCFEEAPNAVLAVCTAGIGTQHIANKVVLILMALLAQQGIDLSGKGETCLMQLVVYALLLPLAWLCFVRPMGKRIGSSARDPRVTLISVMIVLLCIGLNRFVAGNAEISSTLRIVTSLYAIACCLLAIILQFSLTRWNQEKTERQVLERLVVDERKQYDQWKNSIQLMNERYHDLKHMLQDLRELSALRSDDAGLALLEEKLQAYENNIHSGSEVLDSLLVNMRTLCAGRGILFQCVMETHAFGRFPGMELYALFTNLIDNAVTAVSTLEEEEKRIIDLSAKELGDSIIIYIWNYCKERPSGKVALEELGGENNYGLRSVARVTEYLSGSIRIQVKNDETFHVNIILPFPKKEAAADS